MSELISGKEALIALANGQEVEVRHPHDKWYENWESLNGSGGKFFLLYLLDESIGYQFRLKPRTVNLNGVEVGQLYSSQWDREKPNKVTLEFKTEEDARHFSKNALNIFNGV